MAEFNSNDFPGTAAINAVESAQDPIVTHTLFQSSKDLVKPVIANITPAPGSIVPRMTPVDFDVTDNIGQLGFLLIQVYQNGFLETVYKGQGFITPYQTSVRTAIPGGYHFTIRRAGGWKSNPLFEYNLLDADGNEAT